METVQTVSIHGYDFDTPSDSTVCTRALLFVMLFVLVTHSIYQAQK